MEEILASQAETNDQRYRDAMACAGDAQVRAVGTEFDVYKKLTATVVTVVEGRVETYDEADSHGTAAIVLSAGEQLTVLPHLVSKPTRTDTSIATAWVQKRLIFEETPLSDVPRNLTATTGGH